MDHLSSITPNSSSMDALFGHNPHIPPHFTAPGPALLFFPIAIVIVYRISSWLKARSAHKASITPDIPFMEKLLAERTHCSYPV